MATGVSPRVPELSGLELPSVLTYAQVLSDGEQAGGRVGRSSRGGGIGFDVAEFLAEDDGGVSEDVAAWLAEWGISDPETHRGGLVPDGPRPRAPARAITMLQRKPGKFGRSLGKTTGWIHRASLKRKNVRMVGGVTYRSVEPDGVRVFVNGETNKEMLIEADNVVICAGQVPERSLADQLAALGLNPPRDRRSGGRPKNWTPKEPWTKARGSLRDFDPNSMGKLQPRSLAAKAASKASLPVSLKQVLICR